MNFDFDKMERSKQALRRRLADAPIAEKLRVLDTLRQRALTIRTPTIGQSGSIQEAPAAYKSTRRGRST